MHAWRVMFGDGGPEVEMHARWDPEKEGTQESIIEAAAIEHQRPAVSAEYLGTVGAPDQ